MDMEKCLSICKSLNWEVDEYDTHDFELSQYSPAGEDFSFGFNAKNAREFVDTVKYESAYFNQDEHVYDMLKAKENGLEGVPSIRELLDDAKAIDDMLRELACALQKAEDEEGIV